MLHGEGHRDVEADHESDHSACGVPPAEGMEGKDVKKIQAQRQQQREGRKAPGEKAGDLPGVILLHIRKAAHVAEHADAYGAQQRRQQLRQVHSNRLASGDGQDLSILCLGQSSKHRRQHAMEPYLQFRDADGKRHRVGNSQI